MSPLVFVVKAKAQCPSLAVVLAHGANTLDFLVDFGHGEIRKEKGILFLRYLFIEA
jgi:hypothetical protein